MRRVLIVDDSEVFAQIVASTCFPDDEVRFCGDGNTALAALPEFQPELLLLNLTLPYKNGLVVLREAAYLPPLVIAISYLRDPYLLRAMGALGVQHVLYMPTPQGINHMLANLRDASATVRTDVRASVLAHLQRLRIPVNLDGYRMLVVGLPLFLRDPNQLLGKELYPAIVCAIGQGTEQTVERSMRQAIKAAWKHRDDKVWAQYFAPNARGVISCPSTKKFLTAVICQLQKELADHE